MDKAFIYLHIPKCCGTTMNAILAKNFNTDRRFLIDGSNISASKRALALKPEKERENIDLLYGHLSYGWHELLPRHSTYVTVIRDPIERIISHYNYVRFQTNTPHYLREVVQREQMSLTKYVSSGVCDEMNNGQVRLLSGVEDIVQSPYGGSRVPYGTNDPELLDRALNNIDRHVDVVGLTERFDETLLLFKARLGLKRIRFVKKNVGPSADERHLPTAEDLQTIMDYNKLDILLYRAMRERFESEFKTLSFPAIQLKMFRIQNRH